MQALEVIKQRGGAGQRRHLGRLRRPDRRRAIPINTIYLWMSGPEEAVLRVALKPGSGVRVEDLKERLRGELPARLGDWLRQKLTAEKLPTDQVAERVRGLKLSFEPADIVNEVMSFGSPTPDRGRRQRPEAGRQPRLRREGRRTSWRRSPSLARPAVRPVAGLPRRRGAGGPRAGRGQRRHDAGRGQLAGGGHLVQPLRRAELLGATPRRGIGYQVQVRDPAGRGWTRPRRSGWCRSSDHWPGPAVPAGRGPRPRGHRCRASTTATT